MAERGTSLFEIDTTIAQLIDMREDMVEASEDTAATDAEIARYLNEQLPAKVDGIRGFVRQEETIAAAAKEEAARLSAIAAARLARVERLKEYLLFTLNATGKTKLEGRTGGSISVCGNGGLQPLLIDNEQMIPQEFWEMKPVLNTEKIRRKLSADEGVPGAHLEPRGKHVKIK